MQPIPRIWTTQDTGIYGMFSFCTYIYIFNIICIYIYLIHVWEIQRSEKHQTHSHSHVPHRLATSIASAEPQKHSRLSPLPVTSHPRGIWGPQPFPFPTSWRYHVCSFQCWWCNDLWSWRVSRWRRWWWKRNLKVGKSCQYAAEGDMNFEISLTLRNEFGATFTLWKPCVNFEKEMFSWAVCTSNFQTLLLWRTQVYLYSSDLVQNTWNHFLCGLRLHWDPI